MAVLLIAKHDNRALDPASAKTVSAARAMDAAVHVLVAGRDCAAVAAAAARLAGVSRVIQVEGDAYAHRLAEPLADLVVGLAADYEHIVFPATTSGKNTAPRVAALLDVMVIADIVAVNGPTQFARPIYAGTAIETVHSRDPYKVVSVRPTAFPAAGDQPPCPITTAAPRPDPGLSRWVADHTTDSTRPELVAARLVVSGGRGVGSPENFAVIERLADTLGAAIGASRAAVDAGYAPNDWQVGQTGKVVAPELYIAVGISGAIQHLAGMKDSKVIVAINSDPEAPIFRIADYGLQADLFEAVPELIDALQARSD